MRRSTLVRLSALVLSLAAPALSLADQFVDKVNQIYKPVPADRRSEMTLFPVLAKIEEPPVRLADLVQAALTPASAPDFAKLSAWATGEPQKAVIEAIKKVTAEETARKLWGIAQPYGASEADPDLVMAGMYTELGDPPLLAQADIKWLPKMETALKLVQVEATRLQADGKPMEAMELLLRGIFLSRQLANRAMLVEQQLAYQGMIIGLARMRDIAWVDFRSDTPVLTAENMRDLIGRLKDRDGVLQTGRLDLPVGDRAAAEQLLSRIMKADGKIEASTFALTLSRIAAKRAPMRLFSEQAKWDAIARLHADGRESLAGVERVFGDWDTRWKLDPWNPALKVPTDYRKLPKAKFAAIDVFLGDLGQLFEARSELKVELTGTRSALANYGFWRQTRSFAPEAASVRPAFIPYADVDPFDPAKSQWLAQVVPGRGPGGVINPEGKIDAQIFPLIVGTRYPEFGVTWKPDTFVMFSMGPKAARGGGKRFTQMKFDNQGDYLVWPPMLSLIRQHQADQGRWK